MARTKKIDDYLDIILDALHSDNFNETQFFKLVVEVLVDFSRDSEESNQFEPVAAAAFDPAPDNFALDNAVAVDEAEPAYDAAATTEAVQAQDTDHDADHDADHWQAWETELPPVTSLPASAPQAVPQAVQAQPQAVTYATEAAQSVGVLHAADISSNNSRIAMENLNGGGYTENTPKLDASNRFTNKFDKGLDDFTHVWGDVKHGVNENGDGYIQVTSPADTHENASAMIAPNGAASGFGYGLYSFTLEVMGDQPVVGPYALLWPATDTWPGPERDVFEIGGSQGETLGKPYSTIHANNNGNDIYSYAVMPDSIDPRDVHTYSVDWQHDAVTYYVDGRAYNTITDPTFLQADYAHGGENAAPGVGQLTHHWRDQNTVDNVMRLYEFNYIPNQDTIA